MGKTSHYISEQRRWAQWNGLFVRRGNTVSHSLKFQAFPHTIPPKTVKYFAESQLLYKNPCQRKTALNVFVTYGLGYLYTKNRNCYHVCNSFLCLLFHLTHCAAFRSWPLPTLFRKMRKWRVQRHIRICVLQAEGLSTLLEIQATCSLKVMAAWTFSLHRPARSNPWVCLAFQCINSQEPLQASSTEVIHLQQSYQHPVQLHRPKRFPDLAHHPPSLTEWLIQGLIFWTSAFTAVQVEGAGLHAKKREARLHGSKRVFLRRQNQKTCQQLFTIKVVCWTSQVQSFGVIAIGKHYEWQLEEIQHTQSTHFKALTIESV